MMLSEFTIVYKLIGFGVVLGIANRILNMLNKGDIADVVNIISIVIILGMVVIKISNAFTEAMRVFDSF